MPRLMTCLLLLASAPAAANYPETERVDVVDQYELPSGEKVEVADPYRWLEEDVRESDRVAAWVAQQQAVTEAYLAELPERDAFRERLTELWNFERRSAPSRLGKPGESPRRYTYRQNDGLQNQSVLYLTDSSMEEGRVLIDPNTWSEDGTIAMAGYSASRDGRLLAYLRSEAGSDWRTIRVLEIDSGEQRDDVVRWVRFGGAQWDAAGEGFYYSRYPEPEAGQEHQASAKNRMICYHRLGTPQEEDVVVYKDPDHPDRTFFVSLTEDGEYLLLSVFRGTDDQNQFAFRSANDPIDPGAEPRDGWTWLVEDFDNVWSPVACVDGTLHLMTDYEAPTRRLVSFDLKASDQPVRERLTEVIPKQQETLESVSLVGGKMFAKYLQDVAAVVRVFSPSGEPQGEVQLPGVGSVRGFGGWQNAAETFYTYTSYDSPPTTYHYDPKTGESTRVFQPDVGVDLSGFTVRREFYTSKDGTRVPLFLMHKKGLELNGENPTLLYGYGGFTISLTPGYSPSRLAWVERGGVLAVANLRGGGEYGEPWHEAGKVLNKQNVFDDFIAAAEWLCDQKITRPERLGIQGGSNGGLLVGAVMTQRPELFGCCLPSVGVMDMLRFHKFTAGQFWRDEYGSSDDPEQFALLRSYSPYHNIEPRVAYPPTLVTTADTDDRVVPMHSFKFAAALQAAQQEGQAGDSPLLIRIESRAGHGAGKPTSKRIEEAADVWAFLWEHTAN